MRSVVGLWSVVAILAIWSSLAIGQNTPAVPQPIPAPASSDQHSALVGTWDAIQRSYGGIGSTVVFAGDSVFALVLGAMVEGNYKVKGDEFTIFGNDRGKEFSETQKLTFVGDTAILSIKKCQMKLIPFESGTGAGTLVGKWRMIHLTGVPAYEEFTADGSMRLRVPIQVQKGTYSVIGDSIAFHTLAPSSEDWGARFSVAGDTLTVSNNLGQHRYLRAPQLIPLDVQQPAPPTQLLCQP
jgi:hypothetical protein